MPSFILIHPTIWPQYTNVTDRTDRQRDRQRTDSIGRTVLQTVAQNKQRNEYIQYYNENSSYQKMQPFRLHHRDYNNVDKKYLDQHP